MIQSVSNALLRHKFATVAIGLLLLAWGGFEAAIRSDWLLNAVRRNAIAELERVSGGTVTIGELRRGDSRLAYELSDLEVRARREPSQSALLVIPRASAKLAWRSLFSRQTALASLSVSDPVIDLTLSDESWESLRRASGEAITAGVAVRRFDLSGGQLIWNGQRYGLEFRGSDLQVETSFDPRRQQYSITAEMSQPQLGGAGEVELTGSTVSLSAVADSTGVELEGLEVRGGGLAAQLRGRLQGGPQPGASGIYSVRSEIAPLAKLAGHDGLGLAGSLEVSGELQWDGPDGELLCAGDLSATSVRTAGLDLDLSFTGRYSGDASRVDLTGLAGSALGGSLQAQASLAAPWSEPSLEISGSVSDIALEAIALATGSGESFWDGLVEAEFDVAGSLPDDLEARMGVHVQPGGQPSKLPVNGAATLLVSGAAGSLTVDGLSIETPNIRASGDGRAAIGGGGSLQAKVEIDSRLALGRILTSFEAETILPQNAPDGRYSFQGSVDWARDPLASAELNGQFAIEEFAWGGEDWDRLDLRGTLTPERLDILEGRLVDAGGELSLQGNLPLVADGALNLAVSATAIDAGKLARARGFALPIEGRLDMQSSLTGSRSEPAATSRIEVAAPTLLGEGFDLLRADLSYAAGGYELRDATLQRGESLLSVSASVSGQGGEARLRLESNRWPLGESAWARALSPGIAGDLRFELQAEGPLSIGGPFGALELDGTWEIADLRRDDLQLGDWSGTVRSRREAEGVELGWAAELFEGTFRGTATLWQQPGPSNYNGSLEFTKLGTQRLFELLDLPAEALRGQLDGQASFGGVVGSAGTFEMNGTLERAEFNMPGTDEEPRIVSNVFPLRWGVRDGALLLDSMVLAGPDTDFQIDGTIGLAEERELDLTIGGEIDLRLLAGAAEGIEASGAARIAMDIRGTLEDPALEGSIELADSSIGMAGAPVQFANLNGAIEFGGGQGKITRMAATSGGGAVEFSGVTSYRASGFEYRLHAAATGVRVNYPANITSVMDWDLTWAGAGGRSIINGDVVISRMSTASNLSFADLFESLEPPEGSRDASPLLESMQIDVHVGAIQQLPIETTLVRDVEADLDLDIVGTAANPFLVGEIQIAQGELRMLGTHYRINRGEVRFIEGPQAEPIFNVELETRIRDVDLSLVLSGPGRDLDLSYRSDPPLPFHDLVDLVAVGKEPTIDPSIASRRRIEQQSLVQSGADNILSQAISRPVSSRLQRFFGVSRLKVDPQIGGLESDPSARLSTEQQIAEDITLIYSYDLSSAQQQAIRVEWNPDRKWSFIVTRDQNGLIGSDILYKLRVR